MEKTGEYEVFKAALAAVESNNDPGAIGDPCSAIRRWQMHPAWFDQFRVQAHLTDTWDEYFERALHNYYAQECMKTLRDRKLVLSHLAMRFHVGYSVDEDDPPWDLEYYNKFTLALAQVTFERSIGATNE